MARINIKDNSNFTPIYYLVKNYYFNKDLFDEIFHYIPQFIMTIKLINYIEKEIENHNLKNENCEKFIKVQLKLLKI